MELVKLTAASLLSAALFCSGWASAQVAVASDELRQPATVQPAASESDNYLSLASQNGQAQPPKQRVGHRTRPEGRRGGQARRKSRKRRRATRKKRPPNRTV